MKENDNKNIENENSSEKENDSILNEVSTDYSKYLEDDEEVVEKTVKQEEQQDIKNKEIKEKTDKKDKNNKKENKDSSNDEDIKETKKDDKKPDKKSWWNRQIEFWQTEGNVGKKILIIFLTLLLIAVIAVGGYLFSRLGLINTNDDNKKPKISDHDKIYGDINFEMMDDITDAKSLNDMIKKWATNGGEKMSSKNVINFLLIGVDSQSNLSDSMMIMSLDKKNKQIKISSVYRDCYIYIEDGKKEHYSKLNAAFNYGGPKGLVNTLENNFKIKIDDYIYVDYDTFPKIIDALGGIKLDLSSKEANHLNREYGYHLKKGIQKLNGDEALMYSRIRHLDADADVSRTRRQRKVISSLINSCKNVSVSKFDKLIKSLFPYLSTSLSKTEILSLATQAVTKDWLDYEIKQTAFPSYDYAKIGTAKGQSVWIVDYPGAAHELQMHIYGYSNIKLSEDRKTALDLKPTTTKSKSKSTTKSRSSKSITRSSSSKSETITKSSNEDKKPASATPKDTGNQEDEKAKSPVSPDSKED